MNTDTINIKVETEGIDEATEQVRELSDAMDVLPSQVVIKNCRNCKINIYPSQTMWREVTE